MPLIALKNLKIKIVVVTYVKKKVTRYYNLLSQYVKERKHELHELERIITNAMPLNNPYVREC